MALGEGCVWGAGGGGVSERHKKEEEATLFSLSLNAQWLSSGIKRLAARTMREQELHVFR